MSSIAFHTFDKTVTLAGPERAYAGMMCSDLFLQALGLNRAYLDQASIERYMTLLPEKHYLRGGHSTSLSSLQTAFGIAALEFFPYHLNTALRLGSDAVKLLARLHGACERHAYVEGENRAWLADIIEEGLRTKVLRSGAIMGTRTWTGVAELLRLSADGPLVTSYSVCDSFPGPTCVGLTDEDEREAFYDLDRATQWERGLAAIRGMSGLEIEPANWDTYQFSHEESAFELLERLRA